MIGPYAEGAVQTRKPGTNAFLNPQNPDPNSDLMTFSADGTASGCYKKRRTSQKRAFQKVETRDLAGRWCGCECVPAVPLWPLSVNHCTKKKALNEDQYEESGLYCVLGVPCPAKSETRTRKYVNNHPTNGFAKDGVDPHVLNHDVHWHRDPGCATQQAIFFAKKVG